MGNCGYTKESAEERILKQEADLAAFGRPFITNPDLPLRFKNNWPLTPFEDMSFWYTPGKEGYTDYQPFDPSVPQ
jgi:N-ethylmaleimide reductase